MSSSAAEKTYRSKMLHRSNDSGELDVFEAARYFSGGTEAVFGFHNGGAAAASISISAGYPHRQTSSGGGRRISFDGPPVRNSLQAHHHHHAQLVEKHHQVVPTMTSKEQKKPHKQPSSPGGRLASFLNSLFNQAASKKKKKSKSVKDGGSNGGADEDSPGGGGGGRRKRRSSISHFRSASAAATIDSSSKLNAYSSSTGSSGFRTPPPAYSSGCVPAAKSLRELRNHSDHRHHVASSGASLSWQSVIGHHHIKSTAASHQIIDAAHDPNHNNCYKRNRGGLAWLDHLDEKLRFSDKKYQVKGSCNSKQFDLSEDDKETGKPESHAGNGNDNNDNNDNDGAESDSSSDLFELENYDLGHYSSDLPVYESTQIGRAHV